tara:strand:+ start:157 stop:651 length:495 start_codon:yes stop_codon:yes gene_type:complete
MNIIYKYILPFIAFVIVFTVAKVGTREFLSYTSSSNNTSDVISLEFCKEMTSELNRSMPMRVDEITTTTTSVCLPELRGKSASLFYKRVVDTNSAVWRENINDDPEIIKSIMKYNKGEVLNGFCTNPNQRMLLDGLVSIIYNYSSSNGSHIGEFSINKNDCKIK